MSARAADVAWMMDLRERVQRWLRAVEADDEARWNAASEAAQVRGPWRANRSRDYIDLIFAFALARVGTEAESRELYHPAASSLAPMDEAHQFLLAAYTWRIEEARAGHPYGALPEPMCQRLDGMDRLLRFVVDRLRKHSRIIEPEAGVNPYRHWGERLSQFERKVSGLRNQSTPESFQSEADRLLSSRDGKASTSRSRIGLTVLQRCSFAREDQVRAAVEGVLSRLEPRSDADWVDACVGVRAALVAAARFGLKEELSSLTDKVRLWSIQKAVELSWFPSLIRPCIKAFVETDDPDGADRFLNEVARTVLGDSTTMQWADRASPSDVHHARILLAVADGWYRFGWDSLGDPVIRGSISILGTMGEQPKETPNLPACLATEIVQSLRSASRPVTAAHIATLIETLPRFQDGYTAHTHFHVIALEFVECLCLTAVEVCSRG
jgi:hypothetical protein